MNTMQYFYRACAHLKQGFIGALLALIISLPIFAGAQTLQLSATQQAELNSIKVELVAILVQLQSAIALGSGSSAAAAIFNELSARLLQLQQRIVVALSSAGIGGGSSGSGATSSFCPQFSRELEPGTSGNDVTQLQNYLLRETLAGYTGPVTSVFDANTVLGIQRLQASLGIISSGSPVTTGWGRVGPRTRAVIAERCRYIVAPSVNPSPQPTPQPQPQPNPVSKVDDSSASLKLMDLTPNQPNEAIVQVVVRHGINCAAAQYTLAWGDGTTETLNFSASCGNQTRLVPHQYTQNAQYTVSLEQTTLKTKNSLIVAIPRRTSGAGSITLSAKQGTISNEIVATLTYDPKGDCRASSYTLEYGDGSTANVSFSDSCAVQTQTLQRVYSESGVYTLKIKDNIGVITTATATAAKVQSAGAGDPYIVLQIQGETSAGALIADTSGAARTVTVAGNAAPTNSRSVVGSYSVALDGSGDYLSSPANNDFNFGSGAFTVSTWFYADSFPGANSQAALIVQANAEALDLSLGGGGLVLFGNKLAFVGRIGSNNYHPFYLNSIQSGTLETGRWYHAAVTRSGNTITLYLDGKKQGTIGVSGAANASEHALSIGRYGEYNGNYFDGWVDQVEISKGIARWTADFDPIQYYGYTDPRTFSVSTSREGDRTVKVNITRASASVCTASTYTIQFGDSTETAVAFGASCAQEVKSVSHTYGAVGTYTGTVKKVNGTPQSFTFEAQNPVSTYSQASYYDYAQSRYYTQGSYGP